MSLPVGNTQNAMKQLDYLINLGKRQQESRGPVTPPPTPPPPPAKRKQLAPRQRAPEIPNASGSSSSSGAIGRSHGPPSSNNSSIASASPQPLPQRISMPFRHSRRSQQAAVAAASGNDDDDADEDGQRVISGGVDRRDRGARKRSRKNNDPRRLKLSGRSKAEKEIIKERRISDKKPAIPRLPFFRLCKEIAENIDSTTKTFRFQTDAVEALRVAAEFFLVQFFEDINYLAQHRNRVTVDKKDVNTLCKLYINNPLYPDPL